MIRCPFEFMKADMLAPAGACDAIGQAYIERIKEGFMKTLELKLAVFSLLLTLVSIPVLGALGHAAAPEAKTLKIAVINSITGVMAGGFKDITEAVKPTEKLLNEKGGITIGGRKYRVELVSYDDQSSPSGAVAAANKVVQDKINFLLAPIFMPSNLAIAPITEEAKILRVQAATIGAEQYGPKNRYLFAARFGTCYIPAIYDYLAKTYPQAKRIARLVPDDPGARHFSDHDVKEAQKHGFEIVFNEAYRIGVEDFYPLLTKALEKKPDAIDVGFGILPWARGLITQARELGFNGPMYAPDFVGDINMLNGMLDAKSGHDFFQWGPDVLSPKMTPLVKDLRRAIEKDLDVKFNFDHTIVLGAVWPLLKAIEKAQSFDTDKVVDTWEKMQSIDSIFGKARMGGQALIGNNHIVMAPAMITRIVGKDKPIEFGFYELKE